MRYWTAKNGFSYDKDSELFKAGREYERWHMQLPIAAQQAEDFEIPKDMSDLMLDVELSQNRMATDKELAELRYKAGEN